METALGTKISVAAILDRDYRSEGECAKICEECEVFCDFVVIHRRKEIENFVLIPSAVDRALTLKVVDQARRSGVSRTYNSNVTEVLSGYAESKKSYVTSQFLKGWRQFERVNSPALDEAQVTERALNSFNQLWDKPKTRLGLIPGKEALSTINRYSQETYGVSVTPTAIIDAMKLDEIPSEMQELIDKLAAFSSEKAFSA